MPEQELTLSQAVARLDVLLEVIDIGLQNRRVTKHDLILLRDASRRVIEAYDRVAVRESAKQC